MEYLTSGAVFAACPGGEPGWALKTALFRLLTENHNNVAQRLGVWTIALLFRELPDQPDELGSWVDEIAINLPYWEELATSIQFAKAPVMTITSGRYLSASSGPLWDLQLRCRIDTLPDNWFECRIFNLRTLFSSCSLKAETWTEKQQKSG